MEFIAEKLSKTCSSIAGESNPLSLVNFHDAITSFYPAKVLFWERHIEGQIPFHKRRKGSLFPFPVIHQAISFGIPYSVARRGS